MTDDVQVIANNLNIIYEDHQVGPYHLTEASHKNTRR